jgi:hypothetical protein
MRCARIADDQAPIPSGAAIYLVAAGRDNDLEGEAHR